ncbi:dihydrofolate reductase family protein [Nocardia sp. NPDC058666]|uniref:dihydrofolate reductase family protein n=1 Tax=Nocardia sp. NPDC058666 TaxID=3346587 RepID=UPI00364CB6AA
MTSIHADITLSLDGYVAGPHAGPGNGLGDGGRPLHDWIFGDLTDPANSADADFVEKLDAETGAVIVGRTMFEAGDRWGNQNPFSTPAFVLTSRVTDDLPSGFEYVTSLPEALRRARAVAGDKAVAVRGGAHVIRQFLEADLIDTLTLHLAPLILGGGTRLFEGCVPTVWQRTDCRPSPRVTHLTYRIAR